MMKGHNIELRTDEVRDILQKMPHWTIRWGITIIFGAVIMLLFFTYLFRYPDLIRSEIVISAANPPAELKARASGKITSLPVFDGQEVKTGQIVAIIENPANSNDVDELGKQIEINASFIESFKTSDLVLSERSLELGEIQPYYIDYVQKVNSFFLFANQGLYIQNIKVAERRIEMQENYTKLLESQQKLMAEELELLRNSFQRDSLLYTKGVIPVSDYDNLKRSLISGQLAYENIRNQLLIAQAGIQELKQQLTTIRIDWEDKENQLKLEIVKAFDLLKNSIENWRVNYQLISPIDGCVSLSKVWAPNQNIQQGEIAMTIVPKDPLSLLGKAFIPTRGAGKVAEGQRVNIKLNNYPYMEFGMLTGKVKNISPVPVNNYYSIVIEMPEKLTTNYGLTLEMQQELWGNCEIITDDLRLIQRLIYPVKALIERNRR